MVLFVVHVVSSCSAVILSQNDVEVSLAIEPAVLDTQTRRVEVVIQWKISCKVPRLWLCILVFTYHCAGRP